MIKEIKLQILLQANLAIGYANDWTTTRQKGPPVHHVFQREHRNCIPPGLATYDAGLINLKLANGPNWIRLQLTLTIPSHHLGRYVTFTAVPKPISPSHRTWVMGYPAKSPMPTHSPKLNQLA